MTSEHGDYDTDPFSIVAHDLKTPIAAVKGFLELIQHSGPLNVSQEHFAERAMGGLLRMEQLVTNLLDFARLEADMPFQYSECALEKMIRESAEMLEEQAARREIGIEMALDGDYGQITGDVRFLSQVITNLLSNAIKYNVDQGRIHVTIANADDHVRVDIRDTGVGIPAEDLPHVFERFFRVREHRKQRIEGTGLGLAVAAAVVEKHGGRIWVESVHGEGSTFSFTLPRKQQRNMTADEVDIGRQTVFVKDPDVHPQAETGGEQLDPVDDSIQESPDSTETDPKGSEV